MHLLVDNDSYTSQSSIWLFCFGFIAHKQLSVINAKSIFIQKKVLFQTIQFNINLVFPFVYTPLNVKTVTLQTIQFSIKYVV